MTAADRDPLAKRLVLVYWATLVGGLVLYTTTRLDATPSIVALWLGALGGTMLGQYLALRAYRLWIVVLILAVCALYGAPLVPEGAAGTALWQAFIPSVLCGFWSLGDRASIAACWFPAVIWMLSILDRTEARLSPDGVGVTLLAGFAVLCLVILRERETRRVALWRTAAAVPLAPVTPPALLREPPGRQLARAAWGLSVGAITVAITVWLAPRLWHVETLDGNPVAVAEPSSLLGLPCCPMQDEADTRSARVKEYLDLGRGHDEHAGPSREGVDCRACVGEITGITDDVAGVVEGGGAGDVVRVSRIAATDEVGGRGAYRPGEPAPAPVVAPVPVAAGADVPAPVVAAPAPAPPPAQVVGEPVAPPIVRHPPVATRVSPTRPPPVTPAVAPQPTASPGTAPSILAWLAALAGAALTFQIVALALRPVRRLITLRHLRRPFWDETVDQRVSNAWQLALVGLRDAGWRPGTQEAPHALARRVKVGELERCATILERARHGLGIDAEDLDAMQTSAAAAYDAARRGLGVVSRAIGWLRWPLT